MTTRSAHSRNIEARVWPLMHAILWLLVGATGNAADAVLDFRTLIPGVLNAPVYRADGTNRASGETECFLELWAGPTAGHLCFVAIRPFGTGQLAGYVWSAEPIPVVVPCGAQAGDRITVLVRAFERSAGIIIPEYPSIRFWAASEPFSLVVSNTPTPLVGLKSMQFMPAPLRISRQGDEVVLRWSAGDGTVYYDVEAAPALGAAGAWRSLSRAPSLEVGSGWGADWVLTNSLTDAAMFYRVRLLNP